MFRYGLIVSRFDRLSQTPTVFPRIRRADIAVCEEERSRPCIAQNSILNLDLAIRMASCMSKPAGGMPCSAQELLELIQLALTYCQ